MSHPQIDDHKRLVFHTKKTVLTARAQIQQNLVIFGDTMQTFLPGVGNVRRILQAKVPIIRYHQEYLDLEVDVSMNNM